MRTSDGGTDTDEPRGPPRGGSAGRRPPLGVEQGALLDHLEAFRRRVLEAGAALLVGVVVGFALVHWLSVTEHLKRPVRPYLSNGRLNAFTPLQPFLLEFKLATVVGVVLASPVLLYEIWAFLAPNLGGEQRRLVLITLCAGVLLFAAGAAMAYFVVLPLAFRFLFSQLTDYLQPTIGAHEYFGFVVRLTAGFGLVFELPVVVTILSAAGLVTPGFLREKRRHAIVVTFIAAAALTPPDVLSQLMMAVPLIGLYETSIALSALMWRRRRARDEATV